VWFQQDGATAHTANGSMTIVRKMFSGHLISRFGDVPWPPRSPDLPTCDSFLWRYLKSRVYAHRLHMLNDLRESIRQEIRPNDRQLLARVMDEVMYCIKMVTDGCCVTFIVSSSVFGSQK
jgi:hypothetical protein